MWLTKDQTMPEPVILNPEAEKGSYVFFNHNAWQRVRVSLAVFQVASGTDIHKQSDFILHYASLDNHIPERNLAERIPEARWVRRSNFGELQ